jgi:hypothetical protein
VGTGQVRQKCEAKLRSLALPRPFTVDAFCDALARERGRPVQLVPMPSGMGTPCGLWLSTAEVDYVFHQVATSPLHQEHIILHELAHMIFDHAAVRGPTDELRKRLLPALDPEMVAAVLTRTSYTSEQEQEAETLADLIGGRARRRQAQAGSDHTFARALDVFGPET